MLQRYQKTSRGINWNYASLGTPIAAWTTETLFEAEGNGCLFLVNFACMSKDSVFLNIYLDTKLVSSMLQKPVDWESIIGTVSTPCSIGIGTLIRYDTTNNKYHTQYNLHLLQGGFFMQSAEIVVGNLSDSSQSVCIGIHYGLPSSTVGSYKLENAISDLAAVREKIAASLNVPIQKVTVVSGVRTDDEKGEAVLFLEVSVEVNISPEVLDEAVNKATGQTCVRE